MSVTIKTNALKYKDSNGQYQGFNAIAQESTNQQLANIVSAGQAQIAAIQQKGTETLNNIPSNYSALQNEVNELDNTVFAESITREAGDNELKSALSAITDYSENILFLDDYSRTVYGVTITTHTDDTVTMSGTATTAGGRLNKFKTFTLEAGTYTLSLINTDSSLTDATTKVAVDLQNVSGNEVIAVADKYGVPKTFTLSETTNCYIGFNLAKDFDYTGVNFAIMLNKGTSAIEYEPPLWKSALDTVARSETERLNDVLEIGTYDQDVTNDIAWVNSVFIVNTHKFQAASTRLSGYVKLKKGESVTITNSDEKIILVTFGTQPILTDYTNAQPQLSNTAWDTSTTITYTAERDLYLLIMCAHTDDSALVATSCKIVATYNSETRNLAITVSDLYATISEELPYISLPDYFAEQLATKIPLINSALGTAGKDKAAFVFITDTHWDNNQKKSPAIVQSIVNSTPIQNVFFGGDVVGSKYSDKQIALNMGRAFQNAFKFMGNRFFGMVGNHDKNSQGQTDSTQILTDAETYSIIEAQQETNPFFVDTINGYYFYYVDSPAEKTRYIVLSTGIFWFRNAEIDFVANALNNVPEGFRVIPMSHIWYNATVNTGVTSDTIEPDVRASKWMQIFDAYNAKSAISIESQSGETHNLNFANSNGTIPVIFGGHTHADVTGSTPNGIPIIMFDCDAMAHLGTNTATAGTVTEQAVTAVIVDYGNNVVTAVRIGRGNDMTFAI